MALPEPLTTPDMDVRDLDGFMLNTERLLASELWALTKAAPEALRGAVALWCRAWKQIPAASLPDDDAILSAFTDIPLKQFRKHRELIMRGFIKCSDGRLYHRFLADEVRKIWPSVLKKRRDRAADNERLKQWREKKQAERETPQETIVETVNETPVKPVSPRVDTDRDRDRDKEALEKGVGANAPPDPITPIPDFLIRDDKLKAKLRGTRWNPDAEVPTDWIEEADAKRAELDMPPADMRVEAYRFSNHFAAAQGPKAVKLDWRRTWLNWATDKKFTDNKGMNGHDKPRKATATDNFLAGGLAAVEALDERDRERNSY